MWREALVTARLEIIKEIWKHERLPECWSLGIVCPIRKTGDKTQCDNFKRVPLLNSAYKVLTNIVNTRIKIYTGNWSGGIINVASVKPGDLQTKF